MGDIQVSISMLCYNHEKYIRQAIEGVLMQKTNFKFELLIHDDASTDKSADIIREYEEKYPDIVKPIYQIENQYSKHIVIQVTYQYPRVKGKYIALCEGDDYWTDPLKLQKQFDVMESNPDVDMCAHKAEIMRNQKRIGFIAPEKNNTIIPVERVILGDGGFFSTNSLFFRDKLIKEIPKFRQTLHLDYTLQIHGALRGGVLYLDDCMSAYRYMAQGSWTKRMNSDKKKLCQMLDRIVYMLKTLDEETQYKYNKAIKDAILEHEIQKFQHMNQFEKIKTEPYIAVYKKYSLIKRLKIFVKQYFPFSLQIKNYYIERSK